MWRWNQKRQVVKQILSDFHSILIIFFMLTHDELYLLTYWRYQFINITVISSVRNELLYPELYLFCMFIIQEPKCFIKFLDDLLPFMLRNQLLSDFSFESMTFFHLYTLVKQVSFFSEFNHILRKDESKIISFA